MILMYIVFYYTWFTWITSLEAKLNKEKSHNDLNEDITSNSFRRERPIKLANLKSGSFFDFEDSFCDFGFDNEFTFCSWESSREPILRKSVASPTTTWTLSSGANALWVGGPLNDTTGDIRGGYAFHETSSVPGFVPRTAFMESTDLTPTGARGRCIKFWYSIDGLSAETLKVKIKENDGREISVIWETMDSTRGDWREAQALYTFTKNHSIIIEAVPVSETDPFTVFRGYIAVDDLGIRSGSECVGLCSFEGGLCDWTNSLNDDFDWKLGRGTQNPITGPARDHSSSLVDSLGGAYVYIDSSFPRRPDDVARFDSLDFQATDPNNPPCMRFFTFMSGKGVGMLRVIIQDVETRRERVLWALAGNQGSKWIKAQLALSSNTPFKVIFEGTIGVPRLGDIAIDDITIVSGPCSTLPTSASPPSSGDCTFEESLCGWSNPSLLQGLDELDFARVQALNLPFPNEDHSTRSSEGYYMKLESPEQRLEGDSAWFISPVMRGRRQIKCLSFWYLMFEPLTDKIIENLGSMSAFMKKEDDFGSIILTPIWSVLNFQGLTWNYAQAPLRADGDFQVVIEAAWGSPETTGSIALDDIALFEGSCPTVPDSAIVRVGDCSFTRGSCGWSNVTTDSSYYFRFSSPLNRPSGINDHTYGALEGYIFFDIYNSISRNRRLQLVSPVIEPSAERSALCFGFWFTGFGADQNTSLNIFQRNADSNNQNHIFLNHHSDILIWSYNPIQYRIKGWQFGQVAIVTNSKLQIVVEGSSFNGGIALDDFKIYKGGCAKRPKLARGII
ncbi:UNVERIFIED_CONTAM: hypothetical protein RMT77_004556 [Armadillidium vulgare]